MVTDMKKLTLEISRDFAVTLLNVAKHADPIGIFIGQSCADLQAQIEAFDRHLEEEEKKRGKGGKPDLKVVPPAQGTKGHKT